MNSDLHHLSAAYALNALDADERASFEAHYPTCEICSADVLDYRETAAILAEAQSVAPPAGLEASVMSEIARTRQISPLVPDRVVDLATRRQTRTRRAAIAVAVAAAIVVVVGLAASLLAPSGTDDIEAVLEAPDALVTNLDGDDGTIQVVWSAERDQVAVFASGLEQAGEGLTYELWFLLDEGVAPAGLFEPDADGVIRAGFAVDDIDGNGFGVTIEPTGGSDQPTSEVIFAGTI